ncbi:MAG: hypothetical protein FKY71_07455 [Spiribacter salinus]|uniref:KaiB domain-containing protein n=1 Tax=Spiribacter salinus TaxID=1335746 RepID=A0A540VSD6_9GAMM|nr:MAG: hypothetical protein FKY71_07455 [Spiribacter salinus]
MPLLILFVTGNAPRTVRARANLSRVLREMGLDSIKPQEVDLLETPQEGLTYSIFATPSLLRTDSGGDEGLLYGDLSDTDRLRRFLADLGDAEGPTA